MVLMLPSMLRLRKWFKMNMGQDTPLHLLAFRPEYKATEIPPTPVETIELAHEVAQQEGLLYVYSGNLAGHRDENTHCPSCGNLVIERMNFNAFNCRLTSENTCSKCGYPDAKLRKFNWQWKHPLKRNRKK
jgi:pyruvate formate lyase activating enzyme